MDERTKTELLARAKSRAGNLRYILRFQADRSLPDKFDLVTADLKRGTSKRAYGPAALVLRAIVSLCAVTSSGGPPRFKNSALFTKDDHLSTTLAVIRKQIGKPMCDTVIKDALRVLHRGGLIHKEHGRAGINGPGRSFVELKGYDLWTKLVDARKGKSQDLREAVFSLADREGDYGYNSQCPKRRDRASYLNSNINSPKFIESELRPVQNNKLNEIVLTEDKKGPLAGPLSNLERPARGTSGFALVDGTTPGVKFQLTFQVQKIIEFIQTHPVFIDHTGEYQLKGRITAREVSALINRVETAGLSLSFLQQYFRAIEGRISDEWFMKTSLGYFCDNFFVIRKRFKRMEAAFKLESANLPAGESELLDLDRAACDFIHAAAYRVPYCEDPGEYKALMQIDRRMADGGYDSAVHVFLALSLSNMPPSDREFIIAEHRYLARQWFLANPQTYLGLQESGLPLGKAIGVENDQEMMDRVENDLVQTKAYTDHYTSQRDNA